MRFRSRAALVLALAGACVVGALAPTVAATTAPAVAFPVRVTITDETVTFQPQTGKRGYTAVFKVRNLGRKPHRIVIGGLTSRLLARGESARLGANLEERGRFPYKVDRGGRGYTGFFTVV